jgi:apolipoprotein N-acyltransferase
MDAAFCGFICGASLFIIDMSWIAALSAFSGGLAYLGWVVAALFESVFILLFAFFSKQVMDRFAFLVPFIWVFFEWLRTLGPWGAPLGILGYSQADLLLLIQIAAFTTVFGVSLLIAGVNHMLFDLINNFRSEKKLAIGLKAGGTLLILVLICGYGWWAMNQPLPGAEQEFRVALIQGNIPHKVKRNRALILPTFDTYERLTRRIINKKPDLILWPETVVFAFMLQDPRLLPRIQKLARDAGCFLLTGTPYEEGGRYYNSAVVLSPSGRVVGRYDAQRLLPLGTYVPLRAVIRPIVKRVRFWNKDFSVNPEGNLLSIGKIRVGAVICFESVFVRYLREMTRKGADLLVTLTTDAQFLDSSVPYKHIDFGVFRAIENRRYFVQAANTGISAVIDPYGRILASTKMNERRALVFDLALPKD